jgi:hypothetical protein
MLTGGAVIRTLTIALLVVLAFGIAACGSDPGNVESPAPSAVSGGPSFGEVKLATEIDAASKAPITEVTSFASDTKAMHGTISVKNVPAGSEFHFRWTKGAQEAATVVVSVSVDTADSWVSGSLFPNGPVPAGDDWLLAVFFNGTTIASKQFRVHASE